MGNTTGTDDQLLTTNRKALTINLDAEKYGTFAEIAFFAGVAATDFMPASSLYHLLGAIDELAGQAGMRAATGREPR